MDRLYRYGEHGPEPHRIRRRALLRSHPELKQLAGYSWLTAGVMLCIVAAQLGIAAALAHHSSELFRSWGVLVVVAFIVGGTLNHWVGMGIHEASHNLVAPTPLLSRLVAILGNTPIVIPVAMSFRRYHLAHHSHLGVVGKDNDLAGSFEVEWMGRGKLTKLLWLITYPIFAVGARGFLRSLDRWELANAIYTLITNAVIIYFFGWHGFAYLALSTYFGYCLLHPVAAHFIHEHYVWEPGQETYSYYGPLNWVNFNVGYHAEHHDLMWVPCWALPQVKACAPEFYDHLSSANSWAGLLVRFVADDSIGHDARIVRPESSLKKSVSPTQLGGLSPDA